MYITPRTLVVSLLLLSTCSGTADDEIVMSDGISSGASTETSSTTAETSRGH